MSYWSHQWHRNYTDVAYTCLIFSIHIQALPTYPSYEAYCAPCYHGYEKEISSWLVDSLLDNEARFVGSECCLFIVQCRLKCRVNWSQCESICDQHLTLITCTNDIYGGRYSELGGGGLPNIISIGMALEVGGGGPGTPLVPPPRVCHHLIPMHITGGAYGRVHKGKLVNSCCQ